jgi:hypothetical protein
MRSEIIDRRRDRSDRSDRQCKKKRRLGNVRRDLSRDWIGLDWIGLDWI